MIENWLIFTDLDGTLLDHHDYSFTAAQPALDALQARQIPVILNSSKTLAEISTIAAELDLNAPCIAENGSVIAYPGGKIRHFGSDYETICNQLAEWRRSEGYRFSGFMDWTAKQVASVTGLSLNAAEQAKQRHASEPLLWLDDEGLLEKFHRQLEAQGLTLKQGGRFWHVMGQADKVQAMQHLVDEYYTQHNSCPTVIALGDGPNDLEMLAAAHIAVVVYNPDGQPFELSAAQVNRPVNTICAIPEQQQVIRTEKAGSAGWNAAILGLLQAAEPARAFHEE